MKIRLLTCLFLFALICGCSEKPVETTPSTQIPTEITLPATEPMKATLPEETAPPMTTPQSTLYIPGISVEDVISYFSEVCLAAEYVHSGDPSLLQKWADPICYALNGNYTEEDYAVLQRFTAQLNEIDGFPGICETTDPAAANLSIYFCNEDQMISRMGDIFYGMDGAVTFWYDRDVIYDATICYRTDIDQQLRNSVILEEIYNGLGPIQDTALRPDSIIYTEFSQPQALTDVDWLILKLLYHPDMKPGMDAAQCEAVIRQLYCENP